MTKISPLLSVVTSSDGDIVYIHADQAGLELLQKALSRLIEKVKSNQCDHDHLFSEAWGGGELTTSMLPQEQEEGCKQVHHLELYAWTPEWREKNNL